jgi:hypothetical protein
MGTIMIKKIAVTTVLAAVSPALASDNFEIFGPGTQTCRQYLASSEHDQLLAEYWISGFFSGGSLAEMRLKPASASRAKVSSKASKNSFDTPLETY